MIGVFEALALLFMLGKHGGASSASEVTPEPQPKAQPKAQPRAQPEPPIKPVQVKLPASTPTAPKPWPVASKPQLPAFPANWEPYTPPPPAVIARAQALIPSLWKSGKEGVSTQEQTGNVWVTYVSFRPSAKLKGVAAYRLKPGVEVEVGPTAQNIIPVKAQNKAKPKSLKARTRTVGDFA